MLRYNLQPDEGETAGVIRGIVRQAATWFKPGLHIAHSVLPLENTDTLFYYAWTVDKLYIVFNMY
jgi:hypothetical protein